MKVYIAGPMTGIENFNFPEFEAAEDRLRRLGHYPISPHWNGDEDGDAGWANYMRRDIPWLLSCDAIYLLRGWDKSKGARLEARIALELGMDVMLQQYANSPEVVL